MDTSILVQTADNINLENSNKINKIRPDKESKKGKTIDELIEHIQARHGISMNESAHRQNLRLMGYFHGYKACTFVKTKDNPLHFESFDEVKNIYDLDSDLKALFYPEIMKFETAISNYVLEIISANNDSDLDSIFHHQLNHFDDFQNGSRNYRTEMENHLKLKGQLELSIAELYSHSTILKHYIDNNKAIPIWAMFEHITLGQLGSFINRMNDLNREYLLNSIDVYDISLDTKKEILSKHVFLLKELRNAIAHNRVVFDCRFKNTDFKQNVSQFIEKHANLISVNFSTITDYIGLLAFYLKKLKFSETEVQRFITGYQAIVLDYKQKISKQNIELIFGDNLEDKLNSLNKIY